MMDDQIFLKQSCGFEVAVKTQFDFDRSSPIHYKYVFKYIITITNKSDNHAQLISRRWFIKNDRGEVSEVNGPGVVGQTPEFLPGQSFEYASFCPLDTLTGEMWGSFFMKRDDSSEFEVETPIFMFKIPKEYLDA